VAADRVAPVGVAAVHEDVALVQLFGEVVEDLVHRRPRRDVQEDRPRGRQPVLEVRQGANLLEPGLDEL